jgi:hypothetical protein
MSVNLGPLICAFLAQEIEHRIGTTQTLEAVCDALIFWALEETDPDESKLMSEAEIISKVENLIPSAKRFFRGQIGARISALTTKREGARAVNIYKKAERYCLPYDTREALRQHTIEDETLTASRAGYTATTRTVASARSSSPT